MPPSVLARLAGRKIVHWGLAYLAGAWLVLQVLDLLAQPFAWPDLVMRAATVVLGLGFFAALVVAWYHGEKGAQRASGVELLMLAGILAIAAAAVAFVSRGGSGGEHGPTAEVAVAGGRVAEQGSIAVLPFADMSAGGDQEYFADGLAEELLNALARLPELRVASRTSAFAFKGGNASVDSVARALRVAHVLEGSVRTEGGRVRVTAQLIDAGSGYHLWSETYDREMSGIFALQDEIAREITKALEIELGGGRAGAPLVSQETTDPEAHTLVLKALHLRRMGTRESLAQAIALLQEAVERDPGYARAWSEMARAYSYQGYQYFGPRDSLHAEAKAAIEQAVRLAPDDAESRYVLGVLARDEWDLPAVEMHFRKAIELNPGQAYARSEYAWLLMQLGRKDEAIAEASRAVELDPVNPGLISNLGAMYLYAGQLERGADQFRQSLVLDPGTPITLGNLALALAYAGRIEEAIAAAEQARLQGAGDQFVIGVLGYVYARAGRRGEALEALRALEAQPESSPYMLATVRAGLGEADAVFALLERAIAERDVAALDLAVDPTFDPFRTDPRMDGLLRRAGLR